MRLPRVRTAPTQPILPLPPFSPIPAFEPARARAATDRRLSPFYGLPAQRCANCQSGWRTTAWRTSANGRYCCSWMPPPSTNMASRAQSWWGSATTTCGRAASHPAAPLITSGPSSVAPQSREHRGGGRPLGQVPGTYILHSKPAERRAAGVPRRALLRGHNPCYCHPQNLLGLSPPQIAKVRAGMAGQAIIEARSPPRASLCLPHPLPNLPAGPWHRAKDGASKRGVGGSGRMGQRLVRTLARG